MNYIEATDWIKNIERAGSDYGIERMRELLILLDEPDTSLKYVHIAGTNGKGSVSAYLTSVLKEAGYKVGTYNSPSVFRYNERWLINGEPLGDELVAKYLTIVRETIEAEQKLREAFSLDKFQPTAFEIETAVMFLAFYEAECDICVLETGLGGRWDATNVIYDKELAVITPIGLDHCAILGNTLGEIASEKAAIIKDVGVTANQAHEIMEQIRHPYVFEDGKRVDRTPRIEVAKKPEFLSADICGQKFLYDGKEYEISLLGRHQIDNASLAICAVQELVKKHWDISDEALKRGLKNTVWHARFEIVKNAEQRFNIAVPARKTLVFDGSHNPHGAKTLADGLNEFFKNKRIALVLGILKDKDYEGVVKTLAPCADEVVCITPPSPRALEKEDLEKVVLKVKKEENLTLKTSVNSSIKEALQEALIRDNDVVVLCGSLTLFSAL
ncbi:MAG: bifunctional folylpolyglutamate synthase/dihydrofolate synthase [Clostridia bacterium]|nr:bifunctional folylpolyglutamate synthase/dihydrofolate synthase [Clostridia bacterium]